MTQPDELVTVPADDTPDLVWNLREARKAMTYWKGQEAKAVKALRLALGQADGITVAGELVIKRSHVPESWGLDGDAIKRQYPDVWHSCQKVTRKEHDKLLLVGEPS